MLEIALHNLIEDNLNSSTLNYTFHSLDINRYFPELNLTDLESLNTPVGGDGSLFEGFLLKDIIDGDLEITGADILQAFVNANLTTVRVPVKPAIEFLLNITRLPTEIAHNFTVVDSFDVPRGKFANTLGNVALADCHYINRLFSSSYERFFREIIAEKPYYYLLLSKLDQTARSTIDSLDMCNYALTIGGVLEEQVTTYTGTKANMESQLGLAGGAMIDALALNPNITVSTPLKTALKGVEIVTVFFGSIMTSIIFFLAILCTQLIYSLMLSDVNEKTFEFGMLRALGFNTTNIMMTIFIQAFTFSIPGVITGVAMAAVLNVLLRNVLYTLTNNFSSYWLSVGSIWAGCLIGLVIPLFSNILPI